MALNKKRKYSSAILILERGLKIDSNFKNIYTNLAVSLQKSGKALESIDFLEKELLNNRSFEVLEALGNCWCSIGEILKGLDYYKEGKGFEITCEALGSSKQICGGGSYEGGMGFAIGIDRILKTNA